MTVTNKNAATSSNYKLVIPDYEEVDFFVQRTMLPGFRQNAVVGNYINNPLRVPGDTVEYDPLSMDIIVSEDYKNIIALMDWMIANKDKNGQWSRCKDIKLHMMTRNKTSGLVATFYNAFPTEVGAMNMDSTLNDEDVLISSILFEYSHYRIEKS